jgi:FkbM family methyltransferase
MRAACRCSRTWASATGSIAAELAARNCWEHVESLALLAVARPGMTVLDVGANVGYFATLLAQVLGPTGHVFALEPEPENHRLLTANALLLRGLFPQAAPITAFRLALPERSGTSRLHLFEQNFGLHSLVESGGATGSLDVETAALDDLCLPAAGRPARIARRIDLIKADTQGSELPLLRGAERTVTRDLPLLCLEFEPCLGGAERCLELVRWLAGHGYGAFRLFHATACEP